MKTEPDLSRALWFKSSYSSPTGDACVEVALNFPAVVVVRDSKDVELPALAFGRAAWRELVAGIGRRY